MLDFRILGPLEVLLDTEPLPLGGPRQRATLALLLLNANRVVSIDVLAEELYAGSPPVTAVTQVQRQVSELRRLLPHPSAIETRSPGYVLRLTHGALDLDRFETAAAEGAVALEAGEHERAASRLRDALSLWRGPPLADLADAPFVLAAAQRIDDLRRIVLEQRVSADLELGRHLELIPELEALVAEHPLDERFRGQLMLALYRSGRQAEALAVYRTGRRELVEQFGLEPTPALRELERAILAHDAALDRASPVGRREEAAVLVLPSRNDSIEPLCDLAARIARLTGSELVVVRLVAGEDEVAPTASDTSERAAALDVGARTAAFVSDDSATDVQRLVETHDVRLVIADGAERLDADVVGADLRRLLDVSPCDVAVATTPDARAPGNGGVTVPFGGGEHDWAALELGASLAAEARRPLTLLGTRADPRAGRRDASRLIADASLAVQKVLQVETRPALADATSAALLAATQGALCVVAGFPPAWRRTGIGGARRTLIRESRRPVLLVHRGLRPGMLAPAESRTRYTWTVDAG